MKIKPYWNSLWIEEAQTKINGIKILITNKYECSKIKTDNKSKIEYAKEFTDIIKKKLHN